MISGRLTDGIALILKDMKTKVVQKQVTPVKEAQDDNK